MLCLDPFPSQTPSTPPIPTDGADNYRVEVWHAPSLCWGKVGGFVTERPSLCTRARFEKQYQPNLIVSTKSHCPSIGLLARVTVQMYCIHIFDYTFGSNPSYAYFQVVILCDRNTILL